MKKYNGYGNNMFFPTQPTNLYDLAQEFQKRRYNYTRGDMEKCTIPHHRFRNPDIPESRIMMHEYKMRRNYANFLAVFSDLHTLSRSTEPVIELPPLQYPIVESTSPIKKELCVYEREIFNELCGSKVVVSNKKYDMVKDTNLTELPLLQPGISLESLILVLTVYASRLEYELQLEYNPDNTIRRIFFTMYP